MATPYLRVKRLALAAAVTTTIGCNKPDSSVLYEPLDTGSTPAETPSGAAPDNPPGDVENGDAGAGGAGGSPSSVEGPVSRDTDAGLPDAGLSGPQPIPSAPTVDAGPPGAPPDAGREPPEPPLPPVEPACSGALVDGICWYLGELDQACNTVCAAHGGVEPTSSARIGTPEQGGSIEACAAILEALGAPSASLTEGFREDDLGFGCHLFVDADGATSAWWLTAPAFSPTVSNANARLVCGCVR